MAENKTKPTQASVRDYIDAIDDATRRKDCEVLVKLMTKASKHPAKMWGTSIVGFGTLHYKYESGREGETCLVGFSSRKGDISIYGTKSAPDHEKLIAKLGKHKMGKGCLYVRTLSDIDLKILEQLVVSALKIKTHSQN
jgi:uncharacterized protein DUF1801